ncbi:UPF0149 family protein [Biformimicrobium ophioploci]|uniref:YecA family protein n=1 Tax=Biformimicrobium ophioploci TaxID=3036711 RepID=A0ABQ6M0F5_9GAMM|nr:UPF0149 family protein [Microbulbifer sp. NKW57]GMG87834.1 YecA family protein [Microbulbifer sp. NKW57]
MSDTNPTYAKTSAILAGTGSSPSELHGLLAGKLAGGAALDAGRWRKAALTYMEIDAVPADLNSLLSDLLEQTVAQLGGDSFEFSLLLDEGADASVRTGQLAEWCSGFLHGFGTSGMTGDDKVPPTSAEALKDIAAIAQVDAEEVEEGEDAETALFELLEYVRVAAMNIYTECGGRDESEVH